MYIFFQCVRRELVLISILGIKIFLTSGERQYAALMTLRIADGLYAHVTNQQKSKAKWFKGTQIILHYISWTVLKVVSLGRTHTWWSRNHVLYGELFLCEECSIQCLFFFNIKSGLGMIKAYFFRKINPKKFYKLFKVFLLSRLMKRHVKPLRLLNCGQLNETANIPECRFVSLLSGIWS